MEIIQKKNDAKFAAIGAPAFDALQALIQLLMNSKRGFEEATNIVKHTEVAALF